MKAIDDVCTTHNNESYLFLQGIETLDLLESKLQNAPTMAQKERFEMEMKKEIKKLQRVREYFRTNMNNSDIKDKTKLMEAKRRIESVSTNDQAAQ